LVGQMYTKDGGVTPPATTLITVGSSNPGPPISSFVSALTRTKCQPCRIFNFDHSAMSYVPSSPLRMSTVVNHGQLPFGQRLGVSIRAEVSSRPRVSSSSTCGKWWKLAKMLTKLKSVMTCLVAFCMQHRATGQ